MRQCLCVSQNAGHRVVVARGDGIELVIVATRAANRLGEERFADGVELFVDDIHFEGFLVLLFEVPVADGEELVAIRRRCRSATDSPSIRSPAICSRMKLLKGRSLLKESMT